MWVQNYKKNSVPPIINKKIIFSHRIKPLTTLSGSLNGFKAIKAIKAAA